jgi:uncharacterized protein (TIGR00251 family)
VKIALRVITNAKKREIKMEGSSLKIKLISSPREGKANQELVNFLSSIFGVKKSEIKIIRGEKERKKLLSLPLDEEVFRRIIEKIQRLQ